MLPAPVPRRQHGERRSVHRGDAGPLAQDPSRRTPARGARSGLAPEQATLPGHGRGLASESFCITSIRTRTVPAAASQPGSVSSSWVGRSGRALGTRPDCRNAPVLVTPPGLEPGMVEPESTVLPITLRGIEAVRCPGPAPRERQVPFTGAGSVAARGGRSSASPRARERIPRRRGGAPRRQEPAISCARDFSSDVSSSPLARSFLASARASSR